MAIIIETQCDRCGVKDQSVAADDSLPEGWYTVEATDHHGSVATAEQLCPPCYETVQAALTAAMADAKAGSVWLATPRGRGQEGVRK